MQFSWVNVKHNEIGQCEEEAIDSAVTRIASITFILLTKFKQEIQIYFQHFLDIDIDVSSILLLTVCENI